VQTTTRNTSHSSNEDRFVVGWAADLVQVWPEEDPAIVAPVRGTGGPLGTPEAVLRVLAAVDGKDEALYARHYASQAGSVLALTHRTEAEILAASVEICGSASPAAILAVLDRARSFAQHRLAS
jgi:hypothetical protein